MRKAFDGLSDEEVSRRPGADCNSMAWLLWHLCRVEDGFISSLDGSKELWEEGWSEKCGISEETEGMGYGHKAGDLETFRVGSVDALKEYFGETEKKVAGYLASLSPEDLDRQAPAMMGEGTVPAGRAHPDPGERGAGARGADSLPEGDAQGDGVVFLGAGEREPSPLYPPLR